MLITNKDKQGTRDESKAGAARYLRHTATGNREDLDEVAYRRKPSDKGDQRTAHGICPVCLARLARNGKGTRHQRGCKQCGACLAPELSCTHCMTHRVWRGKKGTYCKGCGRLYTHISASKIKHV